MNNFKINNQNDTKKENTIGNAYCPYILPSVHLKPLNVLF